MICHRSWPVCRHSYNCTATRQSIKHPTSALPEPVETFLGVLAEDLSSHAGQSLVAVGSHHSPEVQAAAIRLNALLGNVGNTVIYTEDPLQQTEAGDLAELVGRMQNGEIQTLMILGGNPVYDAPGDLDFGEASVEGADKYPLEHV